MIIEIVKKQLGRDFIQRAIYALGLALWTVMMWDAILTFPYSQSSLGIDYLNLYSIPAAILMLQILRNNQLLWGLIFAVGTLFIAINLYLFVTDAIERSGNHIKAIDWHVNDVLFLTVAFALLGITDWILFTIRPKRLL